MVSYKQEYGPVSVITVALASLANGAAINSAVVDNNTDPYIDGILDINLVGDASATKLVDVYLVGSIDGSSFSDSGNVQRIGSVQMNGITPVVKTLRAIDLPPYYEIRFVNNSGGVLAASGNSLTVLGARYVSV